MKRIKKNKSGVSLAEISVAVLIFALVAIPLYFAISFGTKEEIQTDKVAIANKILESFRDEIKNLDFETVLSYGDTIKASDLPPNSFGKMYDAQKEYKDFEFIASATKNDVDGMRSITFNASVSWTRDGGKSTQKISFIKVEK